MIRLGQVSKSYDIVGDRAVLRDVDLHVRPSEFMAILGPSGSGKSTLLHIMGLLDRPDSGSVRFGDQDTGALSDEDISALRGRSIGFVFQAFHLVSHLTVRENIQLPLFYQRVPLQKRNQVAEECMAKVQLLHRAHHLPTQLSGGECQRTAIARALAVDPAVILADEPTGNLDSKTGGDIFEVFEDLHAQGRTVVIVTHEHYLADRIPRVIQMTDGTITKDTAA